MENYDDVIYSRDVIDRIEKLENERADLAHDYALAIVDNEPQDVIEVAKDSLDAWDADNGEELRTLKALAEQCEGYGDWEHGDTLIRRSYFVDYAQELLEDCRAMFPGISR